MRALFACLLSIWRLLANGLQPPFPSALPRAEFSWKTCCPVANISAPPFEPFPRLSMSLCITDVTNSECVRNYRTLSPNFIVALVSPDLLCKFSFPFVHIKSISILYSSILVSLPELPSFLPLIGLIRSCCFVLIPSLIGKVLRDLDGAPLMFLWWCRPSRHLVIDRSTSFPLVSDLPSLPHPMGITLWVKEIWDK